MLGTVVISALPYEVAGWARLAYQNLTLPGFTLPEHPLIRCEILAPKQNGWA